LRRSGTLRGIGPPTRRWTLTVWTGTLTLSALAPLHTLFETTLPFGSDQFMGLRTLRLSQIIANHDQNLRGKFGLFGSHRADALDQFHEFFR
jgi:hypothetical protein